MKGYAIYMHFIGCIYLSKLILGAPTSVANLLDELRSEIHNKNQNVETESVNRFNSSDTGPSATLNFLRKFGYLEHLETNNSETLYSERAIADAIRLMQRFGALPETGQLDNATLSLLTKPRCGVPDIEHARSKRFVLRSKGWDKRTLSFRIENWSSKLGRDDVSADFMRALNVWADYAHLQFSNQSINSDEVDISISFGRGQHGDTYPFDGPGGILAHAFYPQGHGKLSGDIHFDEDENWYSPSAIRNESNNYRGRGISFLSVAIHELGHSLGLGHSPVQGSVMFPYYQARESENPRLDYDDIMALYHLYILRSGDNGESDIKPTTETPWTTTRRYFETTPFTSKPTRRTTYGNPEIPWTSTKVPDFDWPMSTEKEITPPPTTTIKNEDGNSLPDLCKDSFDTITFIRNEIFVFAGEYMWRFRNQGELSPGGYPAKTARLFPNLKGVDRIDAAFERESDGKILFFSGKFYWIFDGTDLSESGPRSLSDFGLPQSLDRVDAAFVWGKNRLTYFFKDNLYWKYNETASGIGNDYPQQISMWRGLPEGLTSAMKYKDDTTYFFKDDQFWRFDDNIVSIDEGYPMKTPHIWFNC